MFKSIRSTSRFIMVSTVLAFAICFAGCSTQSQLLGKWTEHTLVNLGDFPEEMQAAFVQMEFFENNICRKKLQGFKQCKYTILDNGSIKIEFQNGTSATGRLGNKQLVIDWGNGQKQTVMDKGGPCAEYTDGKVRC